MKKILILSFIVFLSVTGLLGVTAIISGKFDVTTVRILVTTAAAAFYSLIGLTCVAQLGRKTEVIGKAGLLFCGVALMHAVFTTWTSSTGINVIQNRLSLFIIGLAIGHACLMLLVKPRSGVVSTIIFVAIGSVVLNTAIAVGSVYLAGSSSFQLMGIIGIIATFATIAAPALNLSFPKLSPAQR